MVETEIREEKQRGKMRGKKIEEGKKRKEREEGSVNLKMR